jgi:predicted metal-dependent hydrolase
MTSHLQLGDLTIDLVRKNIKHLYLRVLPPAGIVRISAPRRMDIETIRLFAISRLGWIEKQQEKIRLQARQNPGEYSDGESHFVWGGRYLLKVIETGGPPSVELRPGELLLHVRPGSGKEKRQAALDAWYRRQLEAAIPPLIARWEAVMGVKVSRFYVRRMKTRWGSCNPRRRSLRFNTELAKKPPRCLEYLVVHEMAHLIEPSHNARFKALMDRFLPDWKQVRKELNRTPLGHEAWEE